MKVDLKLYFTPDYKLTSKYFKKLGIKPVSKYYITEKKEFEESCHGTENVAEYLGCSLYIHPDYDDKTKLEIREEIYRIIDLRTGEEVFRTPREDQAEKELDILECREGYCVTKHKYQLIGNGMVYPYQVRTVSKMYNIDLNNIGDVETFVDDRNNIIIRGTLDIRICEYYEEYKSEDEIESLDNEISHTREYVNLIIPNVFKANNGFLKSITLDKYLDNIINKRG